jgi:hypothetical protein
MRNWTHRAGRMEVGRGRVVPGSLSGRRGRDTGRDTLFHRENAGEFDLSADRRENRGTRTRNGTRLNCTGRAGIGTWNGRTPSPPTPLPQGARGESLWDWDGIRDSMGRWTGLESAGTAAPTSPSDRF